MRWIEVYFKEINGPTVREPIWFLMFVQSIYEQMLKCFFLCSTQDSFYFSEEGIKWSPWGLSRILNQEILGAQAGQAEWISGEILGLEAGPKDVFVRNHIYVLTLKHCSYYVDNRDVGLAYYKWRMSIH